MDWYRKSQGFGYEFEDESDDPMMDVIREVLGIPEGEPDPVVISDDDWAEKYRPIQNTVTGEERSWEGTYFETYGPEDEYITEMAKQKPNHVWTILDMEAEDMVIIPGRHYVNRFGYFVTEVPWDNPNMVVKEEW